MNPIIIQLVEQSYHKIEDIRNDYIKRYGPVTGWEVLQYTFLLNSDTEIEAFLKEANVTLNPETETFGVTLGMIMVRNEVRMMFYEKYGPSMDMYAREEMFQTIYQCALDYWIHGIEALND